MAWLIVRTPQEIDGRAMADWREYEITNHVPNCAGYILSKHLGDADWRVIQSVPEAGDSPLENESANPQLKIGIGHSFEEE